MKVKEGAGWELRQGDVLKELADLEAESINTVVTSPPYWGLRDYKCAGQMGLEVTPQEWVNKLVATFQEVRKVLRDDGTVWLNLGDCYAGSWGNYGAREGKQRSRSSEHIKRGGYEEAGWSGRPPTADIIRDKRIPRGSGRWGGGNNPPADGMKPKDLMGLPWMVAFALRADGWWLRSDIVWMKPNPMPESVQDRPTRSHEYIFLLSKCERYYYDGEAIREAIKESSLQRMAQENFESQKGGPKDTLKGNRSHRKALTNLRERMYGRKPVGWDTRKGDHADKTGRYQEPRARGHERSHEGFDDSWDQMSKEEQQMYGSNKRDVWEVAVQPYPGPHFATFPPKLITPCILAGCPEDGIVLDPFTGTSTTGQVAMENGRRFVGIDLDPKSIKLSEKRLKAVSFQPSLFRRSAP